MSTVKKVILGFGKYEEPADTRKPYWISLDWFQGKPPLVQPLSEREFFDTLEMIVRASEEGISIASYVRRLILRDDKEAKVRK